MAGSQALRAENFCIRQRKRKLCAFPLRPATRARTRRRRSCFIFHPNRTKDEQSRNGADRCRDSVYFEAALGSASRFGNKACAGVFASKTRLKNPTIISSEFCWPQMTVFVGS